MNGRWLRWLIVAGVAVFGFALVWWVAESWFQLDRSTAVTIATAAGSLMATPFVRWAGEAPPQPTAKPPTTVVPGSGGTTGASGQNGPRAGLTVGFHNFDEDNYRLELPDGNAIAPKEHPIMNLDAGVAAPQTYVAFVIKEPAQGPYALQIVDVHTGETESAAAIRDVPLSL